MGSLMTMKMLNDSNNSLAKGSVQRILTDVYKHRLRHILSKTKDPIIQKELDLFIEIKLNPSVYVETELMKTLIEKFQSDPEKTAELVKRGTGLDIKMIIPCPLKKDQLCLNIYLPVMFTNT